MTVVQEGVELLSCCDLCGMHITVGRLIKHQQMVRSNKNMQMRWRKWDGAIVNKCTEATFSFIGEDRVDSFKGIDSFMYLGQLLHQ